MCIRDRLYSEPYTMDPGPWTLDPGPWTLDPGSLHPSSFTLDPPRWTLHPKPSAGLDPGRRELSDQHPTLGTPSSSHCQWHPSASPQTDPRSQSPPSPSLTVAKLSPATAELADVTRKKLGRSSFSRIHRLPSHEFTVCIVAGQRVTRVERGSDGRLEV
eukprot:3160774-Rhodomonas_salina.1